MRKTNTEIVPLIKQKALELLMQRNPDSIGMRDIAREIAAETGGTLARITERDPYPADKKAHMARAKDEHRRNVRPEIEWPVTDLSGYDVIFIGYPLWCAHAPAPILTFLESHDFDGKRVTVVPFVTYGGSPFARGTEDLRQSAPGAAFGKTIAVRAATVPRSADRVRKEARNAMERTELERNGKKWRLWF